MSRRNTLIQKIKSIRTSSKKEERFEENTFFDVKKRNSLENINSLNSLNSLNVDSSPTPSLNSLGSDSSVNILDFCVKIK